MIKIGLIGLGSMGGTHAAAYEQLKGKFDFKITAIADMDKTKLDKVAAQTGAAAYSTANELFEKADINMADICLPTYMHYEYANRGIQSGLHVFVEKPLCLNSADAYKLAETAEKSSVCSQVGQCIRFWDEYEYLKKIYSSGEFGDLHHAKFRRLSPRPSWGINNWFFDAELSGGAILDLHIHDADFLLYLFGEPKKMHAFKNISGLKYSSIITNCEYDNFNVMLEGSWDYPSSYPFEMSYQAVFEKAGIMYSSLHGIRVYPDGGESYIPEIEKACAAPSNAGANITSLGAYYNELYYFLECISTDRKPVKASFRDGAKSVEFTEKEKAG